MHFVRKRKFCEQKLHTMSIKVYKASAGSGKTYTLVYEYIRYLYEAYLAKSQSTDLSLNLHRSILAVTFTNKATAEMKERIIKSLYKLSICEEKKYLSFLRRDIDELKQTTDERIAQIAMRLLTDILQDYTQFRVSTIDGFFQQIVRSFARELNLNNQYKVELEIDRILEIAVDNMLTTLGDANKEQLLNWLTEFASEQVDNDKSWNPRSSILALAKLITTEEYVSQKKNFGFDLKKLNEYKKNLRGIITKYEADAEDICKQASDFLLTLPASKEVMFDRRKISFFAYEYLKEKKFVLSKMFSDGALSTEVKDWFKGDYKKDKSLSGFAEKLNEYASRLVAHCLPDGDSSKEYRTAKVVVSYLYILGILNEIDEHAMQVCRENDTLLISSTADFINKIIDNSDTPFIYEKVGVTTNHFMIDEFQDTSRLQWSNFVPLLRETVDNGNESMIVGDVKQSIYRWRNGDWEILHKDIKEKFPQKGDVVETSLDYNYRSSANVIDFNNKLYQVGKKEEKETIKALPYYLDKQLNAQLSLPNVSLEEYFRSVYADAYQHIGNNDKPMGYVRVDFLKDDPDNPEKTWSVQSLDNMVAEMKRLKCYGEMAVLVREKKEAQKVAARLQAENIPFYSSEALCVATNLAVRFIVAVLEYLSQPHESLYRANFASLYRQLLDGRNVDDRDYTLLSYQEANYTEWEQLLFGSELVAQKFSQIKHQSLQEVIQSIVSLFNLNTINNGLNAPYIQAFIDKVQKFAVDGILDVRALLDYWREFGPKTFISMPSDGDAVKIMTIHTSKGLEFGIVFIPFIDWVFGFEPGKGSIQLAKTDKKTCGNNLFDKKVSIIPINTRASQQLLGSYFSEEIIQEFLYTCLDVLNVLYVATTRASQQLYISCVEPKSQKEENKTLSNVSVASLIRQVLLPGVNEDLYEVGFSEYIVEKDDKEDKKDKKGNEPEVENVVLKLNSDNQPTKELIAERAQIRFKYADESLDSSTLLYGIKMHRLFELIKTKQDIDSALGILLDEGYIVDSEKDQLQATIHAIFDIKGIEAMFDNRWRVLNEAEMFDIEQDKLCRPDRVMIDDDTKQAIVLDYKFGHIERNKYKEQVEQYVKLLTQMGYTTQGYILYAKKGKLVKV